MRTTSSVAPDFIDPFYPEQKKRVPDDSRPGPLMCDLDAPAA